MFLIEKRVKEPLNYKRRENSSSSNTSSERTIQEEGPRKGSDRITSTILLGPAESQGSSRIYEEANKDLGKTEPRDEDSDE